MKRTDSQSHGFGLLLAFLFVFLWAGTLAAQCLVNDNFNNGVLSPPWIDTSITATSGSVSEGSALTITSVDAGINSGGVTDSFHYTYLSTSGDPELLLKIDAMPSVLGARLGLMIRAGIGNNAIFAYMGAAVTQVTPTLMGNFFIMNRGGVGNASGVSATGGTWTTDGQLLVIDLRASNAM